VLQRAEMSVNTGLSYYFNYYAIYLMQN